MSAFQVSPNHIGAILRWYLFDGITRESDRRQWRGWHPNSDQAGEMAAVLTAENDKSIKARYPDDTDIPEAVDTKNLGVYRELTPIEVIKACNCLAYQSCEHDGWDNSEARKLLDDIIDCAIGKIPGYDAAPWAIDDRAATVTYSLFDMARKGRK